MAKIPPSLRIISECFIQPYDVVTNSQQSKQPFYLTPWDLVYIHPRFYVQRGLLFAIPPQPHYHFMKTLLDKLKHSLSLALVHFFPLAGRLKSIKNKNPLSYSFYVDCNDSPGAKFIHGALDNTTVSDILSSTDVSEELILQSLFDDDRTANIDLHAMSLLTVHVTELMDGVFIGCGMSHFLADGNSFWHFFNMWSEIFQAQDQAAGNTKTASISISRPPILDRWFPDGHGPLINLPSTPFHGLDHHDNEHDSTKICEAPKFRVRTFHFSSQAIAKLKAKANSEGETSKISSFQSLSALVWRCITRVRRLQPHQPTTCLVPVNTRSKLEPPLSQDYFGNSVGITVVVTTAGELVGENGLGLAGWKLHQAVVNYNDKAVRKRLDAWLESPMFLNPQGGGLDPHWVMINGSAKFNTFGNEFGMGKALSFMLARNTAISGKIVAHSGREEGSVDLEVCLPPDTMFDLESDQEFMEAAS
ncbi:uncharacterized acetyltransferase At3g50280 [Ziziphus jujuba]|uniref:Uncharacterized acetyltransferase At3g50280 n=2 Tax=Ziziphus jujuba TaxID=326968 RepID=A0A6P4BFQ4_ZIZJJ|nr:uncharacterized acetyltransferase At3g50280 [Ziziphus jujuba]KAH7515108.1 hypothetical protein FEM48_Zijuj11G0161100 [Ziziphus jujuba var. spinosa]